MTIWEYEYEAYKGRKRKMLNNPYRTAYILSIIIWLLVVAIVAVLGVSRMEKPESETDDVVETVPEVDQETNLEPVVMTEVVPVVYVAAEEPVAASMERDPVRSDIPMSAKNQRLLWQACEETGVVYELALAVIWKETNFRNIKGDGGDSYGYMQVQKRYHKDRMERLGVTDLTDPYSNFLVGCDYLYELLAKDKGLEWALMAYNGGPSYANKMQAKGKVSSYARKVTGYFESLDSFCES